MSSSPEVLCPVYAPFFGFAGATIAMVFTSAGAAIGTAKSGVGIAGLGLVRPELMMRSLVPVVMASIIGIYGLVVAVLISNAIDPSKDYSLFAGALHLGAGLSTGLGGLASGATVGMVGDASVRNYAYQNRIFVGMVLILIFAEVIGLYGLIVSLILNSRISGTVCHTDDQQLSNEQFESLKVVAIRQHQAATRIAAHWKSYRIRKTFKSIIKNVVDIQRVVRGYKARQDYQTLLRQIRNDRQKLYYNTNASLIQAIWKGYWTRKNVMDFYERKRYLKQVHSVTESIQSELKMYEEEMKDMRLLSDQYEGSTLLENFLKPTLNNKHLKINNGKSRSLNPVEK